MAEQSKTLVVNTTTPGVVDLEGNVLTGSGTPASGSDLATVTFVNSAVAGGGLPGIAVAELNWNQASSGSEAHSLAALSCALNSGVIAEVELHVVAIAPNVRGVEVSHAAHFILNALFQFDNSGGTSYLWLVQQNQQLHEWTGDGENFGCSFDDPAGSNSSISFSSSLPSSMNTEWRAWVYIRSQTYLEPAP